MARKTKTVTTPGAPLIAFSSTRTYDWASCMIIGSLFSGIGGLELGLEQSGLGEVAWQVEIDARCRAVLARHWPNVDRGVEDVRHASPGRLSAVDLVCGGFPCQDVSSAGRREGLSGAKSGLWSEFRRVLEEFAPKHAIVENVASGTRRWLPHVRRDLHVLGYRTRAYALSAFDVGAPHLRRRVFVVASHPDRELLRVAEQRVTGRREDRVPHEGRAIVASDGAPRTAPYPDVRGEPKPLSKRPERSFWRWHRDGGGWTVESPVPGVAHGVSGRMAVERMIGNAVCPKQAEAIGRVLLEEIRDGTTDTRVSVGHA